MSEPIDLSEQEPAGELPWHRLDPRMLLVHPVVELGRFLPFIIGVFLFGSRSSDGNVWHFIGVAVPIAIGLMRYATTSYRIGVDQVELRRGLLSRTVLTVPMGRIRTVELTSTLIHRVLGLAKVKIGTGHASDRRSEGVVLDSLATAHARTLRERLLHRADTEPAGTVTAPGAPPAPRAADTVLLSFSPSWVRYAPLTTTGFTIALAGLGASAQTIGRIFGEDHAAQRWADRLGSTPVWVAIAGGVVLFLVVVALLAMAGYLLAAWDFTLSRDAAARSLHITRGLFTTRETSLEIERLRGLELHEPLGLRLAGGRRLNAIVTGLNRKARGTESMLAPAAPRAVVEWAAAAVLGGREEIEIPLSQHGPRARRRRFTRAAVGAVVVGLVIAGLLALLSVPAWAYLFTLVPLILSPALAADRYAGLGHALTARYLVVRSGTFSRRRDALRVDGIIGWTIRETWFQRRLGLASLTATTAGGRSAYTAHDLPRELAIDLADRAVPGLLTPFLEQAQVSRR